MNNKAIPLLALLIVTMGLSRPAAVGAEPLPPRALARTGDHRFYHGPALRCAVLSPDGRRIASAGDAPIIILWDAATGERLRELRAPWFISHLAFSPDGKRLAASYRRFHEPSDVILFNVTTGKLLRRFGDFKSEVAHLQFSADGKQLHVSESRGPVSAWDVASGKQRRLWKPPLEVPAVGDEKAVYGLLGVLSPDEKVIAWEMPRNSVFVDAVSWRVRDADTGKLLYQKQIASPRGILPRPIGFFLGRKRIAAGVTGGIFTVWETASGKELTALEMPSLIQFTLTPDEQRAVSFETGSRIRMWDVETGKPSLDLYPGFVSLQHELIQTPQIFSADGKTLLLAISSTLRLFNTETGEERAVPGHRAPVTPRFSVDGRTLFTSSDEKKCSWDVSGKETVLLRHERRRIWEIGCLAHSADEQLFLERKDPRVRVRAAATGRVLCELGSDDRNARFGRISPDATRVLLWHSASIRHPGERPDVYRLYEMKTAKLLGEIALEGQVGSPVFSPDGKLIARAKSDGAVHLHDAATGKFLRTLRPSRSLPPPALDNNADLLFSSDGEYLIEGRPSLLMRVFQVSSGREIARFHANPTEMSNASQLACMACSPDGRLLAVVESHEVTVRLFEVASGKLRAEFVGHRHGVHGLAFAPDGETLASGGEDNVVFLWDVTGARTPAEGKKAPAESWNDLASEDAKRAGDAIADLLRKPEASAAFLKEQLRPAEVPEEERLTRLLADLDSDTFEKRAAASRELARLGERAETALRIALNNRPSLEARRRIEDLLSKLERRELPPETLRTLRAIEVLEHAGTAEARRCLDALAKGAAEARQTREAKRALDRLAKRR